MLGFTYFSAIFLASNDSHPLSSRNPDALSFTAPTFSVSHQCSQCLTNTNVDLATATGNAVDYKWLFNFVIIIINQSQDATFILWSLNFETPGVEDHLPY